MKRILSRMGYAFRTFVLRKELPYLFGMVMTDRCNLNCFYCESKNSGLYHYSHERAMHDLREAYASWRTYVTR